MHAVFEIGGTLDAPYTIALADNDCRRQLLAICRDRSTMISVTTAITVVLSFIVGVALIVTSSVWTSAIGSILFCWSMIAAWYLVHDCSHQLVFKSKTANRVLGEISSAIVGTLYFSFSDYVRDHSRHHIEKVDIVGVDIRALLLTSNKFVRSFLLALEQEYVPAVYFYVKFFYLQDILKRGTKTERVRVLASFALYLSFGVMLIALSTVSIAWVFLAVAVRIHVIRCIDAFQHSFEELDDANPRPTRGDSNFEQLHTYSFPVSVKHQWLNVLILNFGFHNAHHALPSCPWYRLPKLERTIRKFQVQYSEETGMPDYLPIQAMLVPYHKHRVARTLSIGQGTPRDGDGNFDLTKFTGVFTDNLLG